MVTLKINGTAGSNKRYLCSPPLFRGLGVEIERALNTYQVAPGEHKMVVSEEGLAPGHLGKPQVVFMVSQPAAHHMFHKWARVVPAQTAMGASLPIPPPCRLPHQAPQAWGHECSHALREPKGRD